MRVVSAGVPGREITILKKLESGVVSSTTFGFKRLYMPNAVALYCVVCNIYLYTFEGPAATAAVLAAVTGWVAVLVVSACSFLVKCMLSFCITAASAF